MPYHSKSRSSTNHLDQLIPSIQARTQAQLGDKIQNDPTFFEKSLMKNRDEGEEVRYAQSISLSPRG